MNYYAHSKKGNVPAQEYSAHIKGVISLANKYAQEMSRYSKFDKALIEHMAEIASACHDLGKLNSDNQDVLSGKKPNKKLPINHVDAGAAYLLNEMHFSVIAAALVQAHHIGFPDFSAEQNKGEYAFRDTSIMSEVNHELPKLETIHNTLIDKFFEYGTEEIEGDRSVFFRLLLSCVADADHTDTAMHYKKYPAKIKYISLRPAERLTCLDSYIANLKEKNDEKIDKLNVAEIQRNVLRNEMYYACRDADIKCDISSCDSPVGTGKTTAIMAHLLAQAKKRGLRRIFVILPFTNIISQSVKTYREALVLPGENAEDVVAELHHRADFESLDARHLTALWRAPVIVTTAVAFFETLASNSTATLRRLHELPGSAVFVDESHAALPAQLLPLAWKWINIYASEWNCYWVMASGSLGRFWTIAEITDANKKCVPEIVDDQLRPQLSLYEQTRITYQKDLTPRDTSELAEWIVGFKGPRLVIMNTVQSAAVLADYFAEHFGRNQIEHLSTALTPDDRKKTLKRIIDRLDISEDTDWTLVATSCVEAGVNLSFKNGFRELGSLVSLLQASGRVNRGGAHDNSEMWTFCIAEDGMLKANPGLTESASVLRRYFEKDEVICPELSTQSITDEIALYGLSGKYKKLVINEELLNFPWIEKEFKVINTDTRLVVIDQIVAEQIRRGHIDWQTLQRVSVQISRYKLEELRTPAIIDGIYGWNLDYNHFLGYMAGIIKFKKYEGEVIII